MRILQAFWASILAALVALPVYGKDYSFDDESEATAAASDVEESDADEAVGDEDSEEAAAQLANSSDSSPLKLVARWAPLGRSTRPARMSTPPRSRSTARPVATRTPHRARTARFQPEPPKASGAMEQVETPPVAESLDAGPSVGHYGDDDCDEGCCPCGACEWWMHRTSFFGEYLLMQASGDDVAHAFQRNGSVPVGEVGVVDQDSSSGFRVGFARALDSCTSITASFARVDSHDENRLFIDDDLGEEVRSLVLHPGFVNTGTTSQELHAAHDIDFQLVDIDYRHVYHAGCDYVVNWTAGLRYGNLEQNFGQFGVFAQPTGDILTVSDIDFDGVGARVGIDAQRRMWGGFLGFGKLSVATLFGDVETSFENFNLTTESSLARVDWSDTRMVPMLDYEMGLTWTSCSGCWTVSCGYYVSMWFNVVTTPEYIQSVQHDDFVDLGDTIAFDGFTTRIEYRY
jgi:hypothetical protein